MPVQHKLVLMTAAIVLLESACLGQAIPEPDPRGVQPAASPEAEQAPGDFDSAASAGLFVGIRSFSPSQGFTDVPYAVDDAVDLAHLFALNHSSRLIEAGRVKLALSGEPQKPESRQRLDALLAAGASRHSAGLASVLGLLEKQARTAGPQGALIVAFATHGFSDQGTHYLALADSLLRHTETSLRTSKGLDIISRSRAARRLAFLDACRERLTSGTRSGVSVDPRSVAPELLADGIARSRGQVVFFAAPMGGYAYDDPSRRNGVFSATVIDGLRCAAETDANGFVTADTLTTFVNKRITDWLRQNAHPIRNGGIQVSLEGPARNLPLAACFKAVGAENQPVRVLEMDNFFNVISAAGVRIWGDEVSGRISHAEVADLNTDGKNEVVISVNTGGEDTGKILAFGYDGTRLWSADTTAEFNYSGGRSDRMAVNDFAIGDLFRQGRLQTVALSRDAQGWYQSRLTVWDHDGTLLSSFWHPGHLTEVLIASRTPDHPPRIIVSAVNNDLRPFFEEKGCIGALFMLDPTEVRGEALPYAGRSEPGPHLWYGVFAPGSQHVTRLEIVDYDHDGHNDISAWTSTGYAFYINFDGEVINVGGGDGAKGESGFGLVTIRER